MFAYWKSHIYVSGELPLNSVYTAAHQNQQRFCEFLTAHKCSAAVPANRGNFIGELRLFDRADVALLSVYTVIDISNKHGHLLFI